MEPNTPTSFIPKRPVTTEAIASPTSNRAVGLLSVITVIIVLATIVSFAGVYLYEKTLTSQQTKLTQSIGEARDGIGTDFLASMKRLNARIDGVKALIANHIVVSPIFAALEKTTLRSVQYRSFGYEFITDAGTKTQMVKVNIDGTAKSYSVIALQSDAYLESALIKNPVFSNLTVDEKTGAINFKLSFTVNPSDLSYQTFIDSIAKEPAAAQAPESAPVSNPLSL